MKIPHLKWVIAALLFLATTLNYADRLTLSVVSREVRTEFNMNEEDYAQIVTIFLLAYSIMYAGSGYLVDKLGTRRGFALFIGTWSIGQMLHGLAVGKWSMAACRFVLGLGEPGNWPGAAKAVQEWFPADQRALGIGIFNAGSSFGSMLAPPVIAYITLQYGWRAAFVLSGSLGFLWLVAWLLIYQPPHKNKLLRAEEYEEMKDKIAPPSDTSAASQGGMHWRKVIASRGCWSLILARFFTDPVIYFIIFWLPEYLGKERGFNLEMVGRYAWVPFLFGDIGYLFGGWLSGRMIRAGWALPRARKFGLILGASVMPAAILAPRVPEVWMAIAATCCMTFGHAVWISNLLTLPTDLFRGTEVGKVSGFSGMGGAIGGMLANMATGSIVSRFSYAPIFFTAGLMHPLSLTLVLFLLPNRVFSEPKPGS